MVNRRAFLGTSAGTLLASKLCWGFPTQHKIKTVGLQLYTVRDAMKSDFDGTIAKVAQIGYKEVEFAGYFDHTPQQVRAALDKSGLTSPSCHVEYNLLGPDKWPGQLESAKVIGQSYIVNPCIPEEL